MSGINNYFSNNNIFNGTEIPTQGKFDVGDIVVNIGENAEEEPMWMCIEAGEPGVWKVVGKVEDIDLSGLLTENKDLVEAINELKNEIDKLVIMFNEMKQIVDERLSVIACTGITLNSSSLSFSSINATSTLIATIQPNDCTEEVIWSTSNSSVATVDSNGVVTSKGSGSCIINVVCGSYTAKCTVSVVLQIPCQSLSLSPSTLEFSKPGVSNRVVANVFPSNCTDKVVWESLSTGVCRVDQYGNVTAVAEGEGEIKATCGSKTAICEVYVYDVMEI